MDDRGSFSHLLFALDPTNSSQLYAWSYDANDSKQCYCARLFGSSDGGASSASIGLALPLVRRTRPSR